MRKLKKIIIPLVIVFVCSSGIVSLNYHRKMEHEEVVRFVKEKIPLEEARKHVEDEAENEEYIKKIKTVTIDYDNISPVSPMGDVFVPVYINGDKNIELTLMLGYKTGLPDWIGKVEGMDISKEMRDYLGENE